MRSSASDPAGPATAPAPVRQPPAQGLGQGLLGQAQLLCQAAIADTARGTKNRFQIVFSDSSGKCVQKVSSALRSGEDLSPHQSFPFLIPRKSFYPWWPAQMALHPPGLLRGGVVVSLGVPVSPRHVNRAWAVGLSSRCRFSG